MSIIGSNLSRGVTVVRWLRDYRKKSPVTEALGGRGSSAALLGRLAFQGSSIAAELAGRVPHFIADELHQARLRLETPDILAIPDGGVNIGMGIRIRKVALQELGEISMPYWDHVRLFEIVGKRSGLHAFIAVHSLIVAGAANNPLKEDVKHAAQLRDAGIEYYRDYVVNGGGLMGVASGVMGYDPMVKVEAISFSVTRLHQLMEEGMTGHEAGERFADERMASWRRFTSQGWQG